MTHELIFTLLYSLAFAAILLTGEVLHGVLKVRTELTRKFSHSAASLLTLTFPLVYNSYAYVVVMGSVFFLILAIAERRKLLQSINDVDRKSYGGVLLPVAITTSFVISVLMDSTRLFIIPILILAISDSLAGILGMAYGHKTKKIRLFNFQLNKTYLGSGIFFITAFLGSMQALHWLYGNYSYFNLTMALSVAAATALMEALSSKGLDNITVPLTAILVLLMF